MRKNCEKRAFLRRKYKKKPLLVIHIAILVQVGALELCISQFLYRWVRWSYAYRNSCTGIVLYASIWYKRELEVCRLEGVEANAPFSLHTWNLRLLEDKVAKVTFYATRLARSGTGAFVLRRRWRIAGGAQCKCCGQKEPTSD